MSFAALNPQVASLQIPAILLYALTLKGFSPLNSMRSAIFSKIAEISLFFIDARQLEYWNNGILERWGSRIHITVIEVRGSSARGGLEA